MDISKKRRIMEIDTEIEIITNLMMRISLPNLILIEELKKNLRDN